MRSKPHNSSLLWIAPIIALALSSEVFAQQFARPTGTLSNSNWTASTTTLHGDTDEVTADDADYFNTTSASAGSPATAELSLTALTDPVSSVNHVMRCRFIAFGSKSGEKFNFRLMDGATEIAALLNQTSRGSYTTLAYTLSGAEADAITDYTNLRFIVDSTTVNAGDGDEIQVTWLELEVPGGAAPVPPTVTNTSIAAIQDTTADLGGEVTDTGGADVTERGIYWSTTQGFTPPGQGTKVSTTGTWPTPSTFVENGVTLPESSLVYFQAFATNSQGDGFSAEDSLQMEPSTQASGITFSNVLQDSMTIDWTAPGVDGSIVVVREASSIPAGSLPLDGDLHADGGGVFQGGDDLGSLSYVVYRGPATTANVTGLTLDTTYFVKVFTYAGTGTDPFAGINYQQDLPQENSQITAGAGPSPPTVTNTTIADVTDTTATLGGEVTVSESPPVTERGVYWSTTAGFTPPGQGTKVSTTGSWVAEPFTQAVGSLPQASRVYFKAFALDGVGTEGYSAQDDFWTEPTTQTATIAFPVVDATSMTISWVAGSGDGAIVVVKQDTAVPAASLPIDGTEHGDGGNVFGNGDDLGTLSYVVYRGPANSVSVSGLTAETTYWVKVFEYSGGSGAGINYLQTAPPENSQLTATAVVSPSHNAIRNIQCDQCHAMHGGILPRDAAQQAVCQNCHNAVDMAGKTEKWDVAMHLVEGGARTVDCGSCHALHNFDFNTDNTSHGGVIAENILRIRSDTTKFVPGALEPAIFQGRPAHYAFDQTSWPSGPYNGICQTCHQNTSYHTNDGWDADSDPLVQANNDHNRGLDCMTCHPHADGFMPSGCTGCHNTTQDNGDGPPTRREIVSEFSLTSHHVVGGSATDGDCKVCHYEAVDGAFHQNNAVDLRDPDTGARIAIPSTGNGFTKFTRDRASDTLEEWVVTIQNELCLKCHDNDGAQATYNVSEGGTFLQPFSSNSRDVPAVFERLDPLNGTHHAVRAPGVNANTIPQASSTPANNPTMEAPWNQDTTGGLNNDGHDMITCFDCHGETVTDPDGTINLVSSHGGTNQRMLRTPIDIDGIDYAGAQGDSALIPASAGPDSEAFCTLCHKASVYISGTAPEILGSAFEYHPGGQGQHGEQGGNDLGCMGCHAGIVNFGAVPADNGGLRGNLHGRDWIWPADSFSTGTTTEFFMLGGWIGGWERDATDGFCSGGECKHSGSATTDGKSYTRH